MHFCGMCGTPLPHRPLTAPGAQSTLNFTRVPLEGGDASGQRNMASAPPSRIAVSPKMSGADGGTSPATLTEPSSLGGPAGAVDLTPASAEEPPSKELVPDVSLDEYLQNFRYQPPSEPTEITMRGDASVTEHAVSANKARFAPSATAGATMPADDVTLDTAARTMPLPETAGAAAPDTVESRLGLEPELLAESPVERPRFLDVNEPPKETKHPASGTSIIVGPSFLGLSDTEQVAAESAGTEGEESPHTSPWRVWLAAAVVLVFAGLGLLEWRSQVAQNNNGPVEIIKAKIRNWRHGSPSRASSEPAPVSAPETNTKPEMQVQPQPQNQAGSPNLSASGSPAASAATGSPQPAAVSAGATAAASAGPSAAKSTLPTAQQPMAGQSTSQRAAITNGKQAPTGQNAPAAGAASASSRSATPQPAPRTVAEKVKPAREANERDGQEVVVKPIIPGAEELAKARNASDSAAAAAWLWKATAKGNPDAPVQLADMYIKGDGVPRSCEQAVVLLKTAAEKENARARNRLASMYATGDCVQRNRVQAYRWLSSALAANPNSEWAQQNRDLIWQQMTPEERVMVEKYR